MTISFAATTEGVFRQRRRERGQLIRIGIAAVQPIALRLRLALIRAYEKGDAEAVADALYLFQILLTDAMVAAHLRGRLRVFLDAARIRQTRALAAPLIRIAGMSPGYREATEFMTTRLKLRPEYLDRLKTTYGDAGLTVTRNLGAVAERHAQIASRRIVEQGMHAREGIAEMRKAFDNAGLTPRNPYLLETLVRTQVQTAYSAGRWNANQDPAIQEILWGYHYATTGDDRVRVHHEALDGTVLPKDDPRWSTLWTPNGYSCRCETIEVFEAPEGGAVEPGGKVIDGEWVEGRPDVGWAFNPGQVYADVQGTPLLKALPRLPKALSPVARALEELARIEAAGAKAPPFVPSKKSFVVGEKKARQFGQVMETPLRGLRATQDWMDYSEVRKILEGKGAGRLPIVIEQGGVRYIGDGHHRLMAEKLLGKAKTRVIYVRVDALGHPVPGPVAGEMAALKNRLAGQYGAEQVTGELGVKHLRLVEKELKMLPKWAVDQTRKTGSKIRLVGNKGITVDPTKAHLKGVTPRGWEHTGLSWDDVTGCGTYERGGDATLVANRIKMGETTIRHEYGHLFDVSRMKGGVVSYSDSPAWHDIWQKSQWGNAYTRKYAEEAFAESFAKYYGGKRARASLPQAARRYFAELHRTKGAMPHWHQATKWLQEAGVKPAAPRMRPFKAKSAGHAAGSEKEAWKLHEWADARFKPLIKEMTMHERGALGSYSRLDYEHVNAYLRKGRGRKGSKWFVEKIDSAMAKSKGLADDVLVYRGTDWVPKGGWDRAVGSVLNDKGYASTSFGRKAAETIAKTGQKSQTLITIELPKGTRGVYLGGMSGHPSEAEYLLHRASRFRVVKATRISPVGARVPKWEVRVRCLGTGPTRAVMPAPPFRAKPALRPAPPKVRPFKAKRFGHPEASDAGGEAAAKWADPQGRRFLARRATKAELDAVFDYAAGGSDSLNLALRKGRKLKPESEKIRRALDSMFKKSRGLSDDVVAFRGASGMGVDDWSKMVGRTVSDKGFVSTSLKRSVSVFGEADTFLTIEVPKHMRAVYLNPKSPFRGQFELLLPRNSRFRVISAKRANIFAPWDVRVRYLGPKVGAM